MGSLTLSEEWIRGGVAGKGITGGMEEVRMGIAMKNEKKIY